MMQGISFLISILNQVQSVVLLERVLHTCFLNKGISKSNLLNLAENPLFW